MPKGQKQCDCGQVLGCRTKVCSSCGKQLIGNLKYNSNKNNISSELVKVIEEYNKGNVKESEELLLELDKIPQSVVTEKKIVKVKKKRIPKQPAIAIDWHTLEKGDIIKVSKFGGSVWVKDNGEEIPMGDHGNFRVISHDSRGIHCYGLGKKSGVFYIYMGEEEKSESGLIKRRHNIVKVKKFIKDEDNQ